MANKNSRSFLLIILGFLLGIVIAGAGAIAGYLLYKNFNAPESFVVEKNKPVLDAESNIRPLVVYETSPEEDKSKNQIEPENIDANQAPVEEKKLEKPVELKPLDVNWQEPKEIPSIRALANEEYLLQVEGEVKYYLVGKVNSQQYKNYQIILMHYPCGGLCFYPYEMHFLRQDNELVLLLNNSHYWDIENLKNSSFEIDNVFTLPGLEFPEKISGPKSRQVLTRLDEDIKAMFTKTDLKKVFTDPKWGNVYTTAQNKLSDPTDVAKKPTWWDLYTDNAFYLRAPNGTVRAYKYEPDFFVDFLLPQFTWNDGKKNEQQYNYTDAGGCGSKNYISVVSSDKINRNTDLKKIGTSIKGDSIYELLDPNHSFLKSFYESVYMTDDAPGDRTTGIAYDDFIQKHPLLFFVDPFDRLIKMDNITFVSPGECGKPVIYLYPKKTTEVNVKLRPTGGFTYTEPKYIDGWKVLAEPTGQLTEMSTGKIYPYLFWEGHGGMYQPTNKGFVVKKENVHQFLVEKLALLGLNEQESYDFREFWEPKMIASPYFFVTFFGNQVMDGIAPLNVSPKPDTVIRILMDFQALEKPIKVEDYKIVTPKRKGFTLVEWGGIIR